MMLTRCPACQTVFRLRAEQLRVRHGEVRCGHCFTPFSALDHLIAESSAARAQAQEPVHPAAVEPGEPAPHARAMHSMEAFERPDDFNLPPVTSAHEAALPGAARSEAGEPLPAADADHEAQLSTLDFDIPEDLVESSGYRDTLGHTDQGETRERREPTLDEISFSSFFDPAPDPESEPVQDPPAADQNRLQEHAPAPLSALAPRSGAPAMADAAPHAPAQIEPLLPTAAPHEHDQRAGQRLPDVIRAERRSGAGSPVEPEISAPEPSPLGPASEAHAEPERVRPDNEVDTDLDAEPAPPDPLAPAHIDTEYLDATYGRPETGGVKRTLWGLVVGVLAGTLVMQAAYLFRQDIARTLPGLRPMLVAACARLGCDMPFPREAALIAIETSDLQSDPGREGRLVLHATVKNRAEFVQAWPHLEITLTDGTDTPLARKVLAPAEWLAADRLEPGFAARGDAVVRQVFEVTDLAPSGYRVYVFYP